jgi:hypothetical protein
VRSPPFSCPRSQLFPAKPTSQPSRVAHVAPIVQWSPGTARPRSKVFRAIKSEGRNRGGQLWGVHRGSDGQGQLPALVPALEGCCQIVAGGVGQGLGSARPIARANRAVRSPFAAFRKRERIEQLGDTEVEIRSAFPLLGVCLHPAPYSAILEVAQSWSCRSIRDTECRFAWNNMCRNHAL